MKSVFNISPPAFTKSEIADIARKYYKITGDINELFSDRDQNFIIKNYFIKTTVKKYVKDIIKEILNERNRIRY